jgi:hypothetical protein
MYVNTNVCRPQKRLKILLWSETVENVRRNVTVDTCRHTLNFLTEFPIPVLNVAPVMMQLKLF